jgi:hypothetical protein
VIIAAWDKKKLPHIVPNCSNKIGKKSRKKDWCAPEWMGKEKVDWEASPKRYHSSPNEKFAVSRVDKEERNLTQSLRF